MAWYKAKYQILIYFEVIFAKFLLNIVAKARFFVNDNSIL